MQTVCDSEIDLIEADIKHLEREKFEIEDKAIVMRKEQMASNKNVAKQKEKLIQAQEQNVSMRVQLEKLNTVTTVNHTVTSRQSDYEDVIADKKCACTIF